MGWFPFLFYSTTWVAEIMNRIHLDPNEVLFAPTASIHLIPHPNLQPQLPSPTYHIGDAERAGSFALLCWAGLAVVAGITIPHVTPQELSLERWPRNPFTLRNLWTMSLVWFATCMGMTWFVDGLWAATIVIALCGVPWAVALWVPFAMVGEILSNMKDRFTASQYTDTSVSTPESPCSRPPLHTTISGYGATATSDSSGIVHATGTSSHNNSTQSDDSDHHASSPLLAAHLTDMGLQELASDDARPHLDAGLVLGVHNMYIVFPQFVDALIASCLFVMIGTTPSHDQPTQEPHFQNPEGQVGARILFLNSVNSEPVGWILRFGGLMALAAAYLTRAL